MSLLLALVGGGNSYSVGVIEAGYLIDLPSSSSYISDGLSEPSPLLDLLYGTLTLSSPCLEAVNVTDSQLGSSAMASVSSESISVLENINSSINSQVSALASTNLSEIATSSLMSVVQGSDSYPISDYNAGTYTSFVTSNGVSSIVDSLAGVATYSKTTLETSSLADQTVTVFSAVSVLADPLTLVDSESTLFVASAYKTDTSPIGDSTSSTSVLLSSISETLLTADTPQSTQLALVSGSYSGVLIDSSNGGTNNIVDSLSSVTTLDSLESTIIIASMLTEVLSLTEVNASSYSSIVLGSDQSTLGSTSSSSSSSQGFSLENQVVLDVGQVTWTTSAQSMAPNTLVSLESSWNLIQTALSDQTALDSSCTASYLAQLVVPESSTVVDLTIPLLTKFAAMTEELISSELSSGLADLILVYSESATANEKSNLNYELSLSEPNLSLEGVLVRKTEYVSYLDVVSLIDSSDTYTLSWVDSSLVKTSNFTVSNKKPIIAMLSTSRGNKKVLLRPVKISTIITSKKPNRVN